MRLYRTFIAASAVLLMALGFLIYQNSLTGSFILDDKRYISNNPSIWKLRQAAESIRAGSRAAISYEKSGMHDEAANVYYRMMDQEPKNPDIFVNLAAIQIVKGNPEKAVELCEKAIALEPNNPTAHNNLAVAYYTLGNYELAIEHCDLAVKYGYKVKPELIKLLQPYRVREEDF